MSRWSDYIRNRKKVDAEFRDRHRLKVNACHRQARRLRKLRVVEGYGGKCACCGESTPEFLGIDHKNGGGNEHRRQRGSAHGGTHKLYGDLIKQGFPDGEYQLLCMNCNFAKSAYGVCPHNTKAGTMPIESRKR